MASSPEASKSSSEDEVDFNETTNLKTESVDASNLFGGDNSDDDDIEEKQNSQSPQVENNMEELFGSDNESEEEEFKASGVKESPNTAIEDQSDYGMQNHSNEIWLPNPPKSSKTATKYICKLPNILRFVRESYTKEAIEEEMRNPSDEMLYRNYVRWRFQRHENGQIKMNPKTNRPMRESNTKLVQWEDGTLTMFVGREALNLTRQKIANSFIFVNETSSDKPDLEDGIDVPGQEAMLESHGRVLEKLTIRPMTTASKSHKSLTMSMRAKHNKGVQKVKTYISELDGDREQQARAKIAEEKLKLQQRKKARQEYSYDQQRSSRMDTGYLEEGYNEADEYEDDENVGAIKESYGSSRGKKASGNSYVSSRKRSAGELSMNGFDEYRRENEGRQRQDRERSVDKSDSEQEMDEEAQDEEEEEEEVVFHRGESKKRRMVDEEEDSE